MLLTRITFTYQAEGAEFSVHFSKAEAGGWEATVFRDLQPIGETRFCRCRPSQAMATTYIKTETEFENERA